MIKPLFRPRRLRKTAAIRSMVRETQLSVDDFIYPLFVIHGRNVANPISSLPGCFQFSIDKLEREIEEISRLKIPAVILFGIPPHKDEVGSDAYSENGIVNQAIRAIKKWNPDLYVITDECFCEYTSHGHCGVIHDNDVDNDETLVLLGKQAVSHARSGTDLVAPSGMMDGMVKAIRTSLDENHFEQIPVMSYAVKYASGFYGPFREAAGSTPQFGDRRSYQMDPANSREALKEAELDFQEGADILMVKPALPYLDIIRQVRDRFPVPIAAYNVSGEYAMIKAAGQLGWIDEQRVMIESLTSIKRAGADLILSYFAKDMARILNG